MALNLFVLLVVLFGTIMISLVVVLVMHGTWQRLLLIGFISGLCFYSGIGAAYPEVPSYYLFFYFGFLLAFVIAFWFFKVAFYHISLLSEQALNPVLNNVSRHPFWFVIILLYLFLYLVPLIYPELRIHQLLKPPSPDLARHFTKRWETQEMNIIMKIIEYFRILLMPFFYVALFRYRERMSLILIIFTMLLYFQFVSTGYIGRSAIGMVMATFFIAFWVSRPKYRRIILLIVILIIPIFLVSSYYYSIVRIGGSFSGVKPLQAIVNLMKQETSFPHKVGIPIIESQNIVNLYDFTKWIITLPIPKLLTGEIEGARINYEISEIVLGLNRGERGWYIVLPGLVAESVYIYGRYFFWVHAFFIAFFAAFLLRLMEKIPQLLFLKAYLLVIFAFQTNRGGISGPLGIFINQFMFFYLFVLFAIFILPIISKKNNLFNRKLE